MQTLTETVYKLSPPGGLFNETVVRNLFADRAEGARELLVYRAIKSGEVLRLKRGTYVLAPEYRKSDPHQFAVAAILHSPSHVSLESALAYSELIPEAVYQVGSVTVRRSRTFDTPLGVFSFHCVPTRYPRAGVEALKVADLFWAYVAMPLRAIADIIYLNPSVTWQVDGPSYLFESLRIEEDDLRHVSFDRCEEIICAFRSRRVKAFLRGMQEEFAP